MLLWPLIALAGHVLQDGGPARRQKLLLAAGAACMIAVQALTVPDVTALWRPLCIATLALWLLCVRAGHARAAI